MRRYLAAFLLIVAALPLRAAPADDLIRALRVPDMLEIMRTEGLNYGADMAADMFATGQNPKWEKLVSDIYDTDKMETLVRQSFVSTLENTDTGPLVDYFTSEAGRYVVTLELSARRAMIDKTVEETARAAYHTAVEEGDPRLEQIDSFVEANDLIEANVAGALNASYQFYRGLVDGGALSLSEDDILRDVWTQEEETRADTREWLYGYLLMAYEPIADDALEVYFDLAATPEGQALNRALFAGFNRMYDEISYALGLAAAAQMRTQEL